MIVFYIVEVSKMVKLYSLEETAELLGVHHTTLRRMARRGEIPYVRVGRLWKFDPQALEKWIAMGGTAAKENSPHQEQSSG